MTEAKRGSGGSRSNRGSSRGGSDSGEHQRQWLGQVTVVEREALMGADINQRKIGSDSGGNGSPGSGSNSGGNGDDGSNGGNSESNGSSCDLGSSTDGSHGSGTWQRQGQLWNQQLERMAAVATAVPIVVPIAAEAAADVVAMVAATDAAMQRQG